MNDVKLKILSDIECWVYIDNEYVTTARKDQVEILGLQKGQYWVQCVNKYNPNQKIEQIVELENHKVLKLDFNELIIPDANAHSLVKEVIPCIYEDANNFSDGLAPVKYNGKWGYINTKGQIVIPYIYDNAGSFSEGLACVRKNGKHGYINLQGQIVIPFTYERAGNFRNGLARVHRMEPWEAYGKRGYINKKGEIIIPIIYDTDVDSIFERFNDGILLVRQGQAPYIVKYGYVNKNGETITPVIYDSATEFREGFAAVKRYGKWGLINMQGKELVPPIYDSIYN